MAQSVLTDAVNTLSVGGMINRFALTAGPDVCVGCIVTRADCSLSVSYSLTLNQQTVSSGSAASLLKSDDSSLIATCPDKSEGYPHSPKKVTRWSGREEDVCH